MSHQANYTHLVLGPGDCAIRHGLLERDHAADVTTHEVSLQTVDRRCPGAGGVIFRQGRHREVSASSVKLFWGKLEVRSLCVSPGSLPPAA